MLRSEKTTDAGSAIMTGWSKQRNMQKKGKFDYFTTTLLYSKFQDHELMKEMGEALAKEYGVPFLYKDLREFWKEGIELSKTEDMYRQQYCGCIYSERDRYYHPEKFKKV